MSAPINYEEMGIQFDVMTLMIIAQLRNVDMIKIIELMEKSDLFKYIYNCTILVSKFLVEGEQSAGSMDLLEKFREAMVFFQAFANVKPNMCGHCTDELHLCETCAATNASIESKTIDRIYMKIVDNIINSVIAQKAPECFQLINSTIVAIQHEIDRDAHTNVHLNALLLRTQEQILSLPILVCTPGTPDETLASHSNQILRFCANAIAEYNQSEEEHSDTLKEQLSLLSQASAQLD